MVDGVQELSHQMSTTALYRYQRSYTVLMLLIFFFFYLKEDDVKGYKRGLQGEAAGPAVLHRGPCSPGLAAWKATTAGSQTPSDSSPLNGY